MAKCRATIRECARLCELSEGERRIPDEAFDSDGELDADHIVCARCGSAEESEVSCA